MILYDTVIVHVCYGLNVLALYKYLYMDREIFSCTDLRIRSLILAFFSWRQAGAACSLYFLTYTSFVHVYVVEFLSLHVCLRGMEDLIFGQAIDDLS